MLFNFPALVPRNYGEGNGRKARERVFIVSESVIEELNCNPIGFMANKPQFSFGLLSIPSDRKSVSFRHFQFTDVRNDTGIHISASPCMDSDLFGSITLLEVSDDEYS